MIKKKIENEIKKKCENSAVKNLYKFYKIEIKSKKMHAKEIRIYFGIIIFLVKTVDAHCILNYAKNYGSQKILNMEFCV